MNVFVSGEGVFFCAGHKAPAFCTIRVTGPTDRIKDEILHACSKGQATGRIQKAWFLQDPCVYVVVLTTGIWASFRSLHPKPPSVSKARRGIRPAISKGIPKPPIPFCSDSQSIVILFHSIRFYPILVFSDSASVLFCSFLFCYVILCHMLLCCMTQDWVANLIQLTILCIYGNYTIWFLDYGNIQYVP